MREAPEQALTDISIGNPLHCGIGDDQMLVCWGGGELATDLEEDMPGGVVDVAMADGGAGVVVTEDGEVVVWNVGTPPVFGGRFRRVAASGGVACALAEDGRVFCASVLNQADNFGLLLVP